MRIFVRVKSKSHQDKVEQTRDGYVIYLQAPPIKNRANAALITLLSKHFGIPKSQIIIVSGEKSKRKNIEIKTS